MLQFRDNSIKATISKESVIASNMHMGPEVPQGKFLHGRAVLKTIYTNKTSSENCL